MVGLGVLAGRDPQPALAVHGIVLVLKVDALADGAALAALAEGAGACRQLRLDLSVGLDPFGQRVLAVLNDTGLVSTQSRHTMHIETTYALLASYPS